MNPLKPILVSLCSVAFAHATEVTPSIELKPVDSDLGIEADANQKVDFRIHVDLDGNYIVNKKKLSPEQLKKELTQLKKRKPEPLVELSLNQNLESEVLVNLLNLLVEKGISKIQFAATNE